MFTAIGRVIDTIIGLTIRLAAFFALGCILGFFQGVPRGMQRRSGGRNPRKPPSD